MCDDKFNLYGINATTHPVAPLLIVNGPIVDDINPQLRVQRLRSGLAIKQYDRPRDPFTIGERRRRASGRHGSGNPRASGKFSFCIAENEAKSPWESFHVRRGYDSDESTVTVIAAEALPNEVNDHVSEDGGGILTVAADVLATMGHNNAYVTHGEVTVVFGPEHAETIYRDGYSVSDVKWFLYDNARNRLGKLKSGGLYGIHDHDRSPPRPMMR